MPNTKIVKLDDGTTIALASGRRDGRVIVMATLEIGFGMPFHYCCKHAAKNDVENSEKMLSIIIANMALEEFES